MLSTAPAIDAAIAKATSDPYYNLPRAVFLVATSNDASLYEGKGGWARLPAEPVSNEVLEREGEPITADSIFELYSATKLIAAIAVLQLVDEGKMRLDDDASKYIPELKETKLFKGFGDADGMILEDNTTPITIKMLLTHAAGFQYFMFNAEVVKIAQKLGIRALPNAEGAVRGWVTKVPLMFKPGEHFNYGPNIDWVTLAVEAVSGKPLEQYFKAYIFEPLGIHDMSFMPNPSQISMAFTDEEDPSKPLVIRPSAPLSKTQHFGGAGLKGSPRSYLKILRLLLRGGELDGVRILKKETVDLMFEDHLTTDQQRQELRFFGKDLFDPATRRATEPSRDLTHGIGGALTGKGLATGRGAGALTWSGMANTYWVVDREKDVAFVVWTNVMPFACQPIHNLWFDIESELYKGLA
ncbi:beta-lactamase [Rhodotorula toruloides]|uniref:Beta-lactamase n=1 Tax=Rhodotorula toruloides TaxID=5286 RepID=A0A511KGE6_RHOTO|nr:beta-lactamase [Rhodotorula toruloides]